MIKSKLIKRLEWYYPMERMHALITFPAIIGFVLLFNLLQDTLFLIYGLLVCVLILYQGQHYWKLKLLRLKGNKIDQKKNLAFFRKSKFSNIILIGLMPLILLVQFYIHAWEIKSENLFAWGILANAFAVLEHLNYYVLQISIDNKADFNYVIRHKRLKRASLAKDLENNRL